MSMTIIEEPGSRKIDNDEPSITVNIKVVGENDEWLVNGFIFANTPMSYQHQRGLLHRGWWRLEEEGFRVYRATIPYRKRIVQPGEFTFRFDGTGGTAHFSCARQHIADYGRPGDPAGNNINQHGGLIGVTDNGEVEGTDIYVPCLKLSYSFRHPEGVVNELLAKTLARASAKTNSDTWRTFSPGELLYIGSTGEDGRDSEATCDYHILASENATGLSFADIVGIAKKGWEYLWVGYVPNTVAGKAAKIPDRVHIERLYNSMSFADTFGWS